jgi:alpha-mannosidase
MKKREKEKKVAKNAFRRKWVLGWGLHRKWERRNFKSREDSYKKETQSKKIIIWHLHKKTIS